MKDDEKYCGICTKFEASKAPKSVQEFGKRLFFNEDGSQRTDVNPSLQITFALSEMADREYGHRTCSVKGAASGASPCQSPVEFQEKKVK